MTSSTDSADVSAIVVTYNRKDLLRECVQAILAQSYPVSRILIVNNLSNDGTLEMLSSEFPPSSLPPIEVLTLTRNVGGAGGFEAGVRHLFSAGAEWLWLMDDDTIPDQIALEQLLAGRARFAADNAPDLLASKVIWSDGSLHPMNRQWIKGEPLEEVLLAAGAGAASIRTTTFVSLLLRRSLVERYGFPIGSYFLGGDDVEYTTRILRHEFGALIPQSVVTHKTLTSAGTMDAPPLKFYYYVRNTLWMLTRSNALGAREAFKLAFRFVASLGAYLSRTRYGRESWGAIVRGLWDGIVTQPHD